MMPPASACKKRHRNHKIQTKGQFLVALINAWLLLQLSTATLACDLCARCMCSSKDAYCVSSSLGEPVADSNDVETLYIKNSTVTDDFLAASYIPLIRKLHIIDSQLAKMSKSAFRHLYNLELLEISSTDLEQLWSKALARNSRLQHVDFSGNRLIDLPVGLFSRQVDLCSVSLRGNRLAVVRNRTFAVNRKINHLDLSRNLIRLVEPGALHISDLSTSAGHRGTVNISNNQLEEILSHTFLQSSDVSVLDISCNRISILHPQAFEGLGRLTELYLQNNSLGHIQSQVFSPLTNLEVLDLSDNALQELPSGAFSSCRTLRRLQLSRNRLRLLRADAFIGLSALRDLHLDGNLLAALGDVFSTAELPGLGFLSAVGNAITCVHTDAFRGCPALTGLDLSGNAVARIQNGAFARNARLRQLRLADNALRRVDCASFFNLTALEELDLRGNALQELRSVAFGHLGNLKVLHLSLGEAATCECSVFANLRRKGVRLELEYRALSEECSTYYAPEGTVDCTANDVIQNECTWRYEAATTTSCNGCRMAINIILMLVLVVALRV